MLSLHEDLSKLWGHFRSPGGGHLRAIWTFPRCRLWIQSAQLVATSTSLWVMLLQVSAATDGASGHALAAFCAEVKANLKSLGIRSSLASSHDWNFDSSSSELDDIKGGGLVNLSLNQSPAREIAPKESFRQKLQPCVLGQRAHVPERGTVVGTHLTTLPLPAQASPEEYWCG